MNLLNARLHGFLDLATVAVFLLAPFVFGLGGYVAAVAWGLAVVHLLMTLLTRYPLGLVKVIPFPVHGAVELVVGVVLVLALPRLLRAGPGSPARTFFVGAGVAILVVWLLTRYRESPRPWGGILRPAVHNSVCAPSSTTRFGGRPKKLLALVALRIIDAKSLSRQIAIPLGRLVTISR